MNVVGWSIKQAIWKLFPLFISISFATDVYVPALPLIGEYFSIYNSSLQATLYVFMFTVAFAQLIIGPLADILGRRMLGVGAAVFYLSGSLLCGFSNSLSVLLIGRVLQAIGACGTYLLCFIIVRDNFRTKECGQIFSLLWGVNAIVASIAPLIGGGLVDITATWRSGFMFVSAIAVLILLAAVFNIPNYQPANKNKYAKLEWRTWLIIFKNSYFQKYTIFAACGLLGLYLFCALSPVILIKNLHISATQYGMLFSLNALIVFASNLLAAHLAKTRKLETIVFGGIWLVIVAGVLMIAVNLVSTSVYSFMLPMYLMTIGLGCSMGSAVALALRDLEKLASVATSIVASIQFGFAALVGCLGSAFSISPISLALPVLLVAITGLMLCHRHQGTTVSLFSSMR